MRSLRVQRSFLLGAVAIAGLALLITEAGRGDGLASGESAAASIEQVPVIGYQTSMGGTIFGTMRPAMLAEAESHGAERCYFIAEPCFLDSDLEFAPDKLEQCVDQLIDPSYTGLVLLDWESDSMLQRTRMDPSSEGFQTAVASFLELLAYAKELRPNARWSFYGFPHVRVTFFDSDGVFQRWHEVSVGRRQNALNTSTQAKELVAAVDFIAPSIYDQWHSADSPEADTIGQRTFVEDAVRHVKRIAGDTPVLPVVWHRVASSTWHQQQGVTVFNPDKLFSTEEWLGDQVRPALAAGADGLIWWGKDWKMSAEGLLTLIPWISNEFYFPYTGDAGVDGFLLDWMHTLYGDAYIDECTH